jgi:hypothetical protein
MRKMDHVMASKERRSKVRVQIKRNAKDKKQWNQKVQNESN